MRHLGHCVLLLAFALGRGQRWDKNWRVPVDKTRPPSVGDRIVGTSDELADALNNTENTHVNGESRCSLQLEDGAVIYLGDRTRSSANTLLVLQSFRRPGGASATAVRCLYVTLWSKNRAILDGEYAGRLLSVSWTAQLRLENITLRGGSARGTRNDGGCVWVSANSALWMKNVHIEDCRAQGSGGGLYADLNAYVEMYHSSFKNCSAVSSSTASNSSRTDEAPLEACGRVKGGAASIAGATMDLEDVTVEGSSVREVNFRDAYGGGLAVQAGGNLRMRFVRFLENRLAARRLAFGGCLGVEGGEVLGFNLNFRGCHSNSVQGVQESDSAAALGGAIGVQGGDVRLYRIDVEDSGVSHPNGARVLHTSTGSTVLSMATIRLDCGAQLTQPLFATFGDQADERECRSFLNLRDLTLNLTGCESIDVVRKGTCLVECECGVECDAQQDPCGENTACKMSDAALPTPQCGCEADPDPASNAFVPFIQHPSAYSHVTAPYEEWGCLEEDKSEPQRLQLNPNWWRVSENSTDFHRCVEFWQPGEPTPCSGNLQAASFGDDLCEPLSGLSGPLCSVCSPKQWKYFDLNSKRCGDCGERVQASLIVLAALTGSVLLVLGAMATVRWFRGGQLLSRRQHAELERTWHLVLRTFPTGKVKIFVGYFQVVNVMGRSFGISWPKLYYDMMVGFDWLSLNWVEFAAPRECLGPFENRLYLNSLVPWAIILAYVGWVIAKRAVLKRFWSTETTDQGSECSKEALRQSMLSALPNAVVLIFAVTPYVSSIVFSTFSCRAFDGEPGETLKWLSDDYSVFCYGDGYYMLQVAAGFFIFLWPVGVPLLFGGLVFAARGQWEGSAELSRAVRFLHAEYRDECFYWEVLELARKLLLTGFVLLIPQQFEVLRVVLAILIQVVHGVMLQAVQPYKVQTTMFFAVAVSVVLQCTLLLALLARAFQFLEPEDIARMTSFEDIQPIAILILVFNFGVLMATLVLVGHGVKAVVGDQLLIRTRIGELRAGTAPPIFPPEHARWHLFVSHSWPDQKVAVLIKQRLLQLLPGVSIFAAAEDLEVRLGNAKSRGLDQMDGLEMYVGQSQAFLLIHGDHRLVTTGNRLQCMQLDQLQRRELAAAQQRGMPTIRLYDPDAGELDRTTDQLKRTEDLLSPFDPELEGAMLEWPNGVDFQELVLARLAERVLLASPGYDGFDEVPLYTRSGLAWKQPQFSTPAGCTLYVSPHNPEAKKPAFELSQELHNLKVVDVRSHGRRSRARWLLFLSASTFDGDVGEKLEFEVVTALKSGVQPLILYSPEANAFSDVVQALPREIVSVGLYGPRTIEWRAGVMRPVSLRMIAKALGATMDAAKLEAQPGCLETLCEWFRGQKQDQMLSSLRSQRHSSASSIKMAGNLQMVSLSANSSRGESGKY